MEFMESMYLNASQEQIVNKRDRVVGGSICMTVRNILDRQTGVDLQQSSTRIGHARVDSFG